MTVAELIDHLRTLPQGHLVVYRACSDMNVLHSSEVTVARGVKHHNLDDVVRDYTEWEWKPGAKVGVCPKCSKWTNRIDELCPYCRLAWLITQDKVPEFVDVVQFPGN